MTVHVHDDQLDGHLYARCGRVKADSPLIKRPDVFEATDPKLRCPRCERWWFPNGQPDWHLKQAQRELAELERQADEPHVNGWPLYSGLPVKDPA